MSLITCPECGRRVSDAAEVCPGCGYPMRKRRTGGVVRIKLNAVMLPTATKRTRVTIWLNGKTAWEGQAGEIAELRVNGPARIRIKYHFNITTYGGKCEGVIDPAKGLNYNVACRPGIFKTILTVQRVDYITSDPSRM